MSEPHATLGYMANQKVSMTTFMDFVSKAGTTKVTVVKNFKNGDYSPATDFYKAVREAIVDVHATGKPKATLDLVLSGIKDPKKVAHYPAIVAGHKKFMGKRKFGWFKPPNASWSGGGLRVSVNPELGLEIDGVPHIVKLYFKADRLAKKNLPIMTRLMEKGLALGANAPVLAVLDVRRGALHVAPPPPIGIDAMLESEAAYFANVLANV
jgi:hypothetical protein